jgi:hypothetical protein
METDVVDCAYSSGRGLVSLAKSRPAYVNTTERLAGRSTFSEQASCLFWFTRRDYVFLDMMADFFGAEPVAAGE